jgi:hypothetical protein
MGKLKNKLIDDEDTRIIEAEKTRHLEVMSMYDDDKFIKYTLLLALAYFGGHVLYYIGLELSCYLYGILQ